MFDIGFSEMMVIAVVALVVIGPEKLPRVARTVGAYLGRLQRYVNDVKADINREIELDELRKFKQQVEDTARGFESTVRDEMHKTESELNQVAQDLAGPSATPATDPANSSSTAPATLPAAADSGLGAGSMPPAQPAAAAAPQPDVALAGGSSPASAAVDAGAKRAA